MLNKTRKQWFSFSLLVSVLTYLNILSQSVHFGIVFYIPKTVYASEIDITGYPGSNYFRDYMVFKHNLTWIQAYHHCLTFDDGRFTQPVWTGNWRYIKSAVTQHGWPSFLDIWMGIIKDEWDDTWYASRNCERTKLIVNNDISGTLQCLLLNMSTENTAETSYYAAPCSTTAAHICSIMTGFINDSTAVTGYTLYDNMTLTKGRLKDTFVVPFDDCIRLCFDCFKCYGAEYIHFSGECKTYFANPINLPIDTTITESSDNRTLIWKTTFKVFFPENSTTDIGNKTFSDYPCQTEATTDTLKTTTPLPTTLGCLCNCTISYVNKTYGEIITEMEIRKKQLMVKKRSLSAHLRTKTSAADDRVSSGSMGFLSIIILCFVLFFVISGDMLSVVRYIFKK